MQTLIKNGRKTELVKTKYKLNFNFGEVLMEKKIWVYSDDKTIVKEDIVYEPIYDRSRCSHCDHLLTDKGHDYCIKNLPKTIYACCGHGKEFNDLKYSHVYAARTNGFTVKFHKLEDMKKYFEMEKNW